MAWAPGNSCSDQQLVGVVEIDLKPVLVLFFIFYFEMLRIWDTNVDSLGE